MKVLPPNFSFLKLEKYEEGYLVKFFECIQDNTVIYYGKCGQYYDYLEPIIKALFPSLIIEYIDPEHHLSKYVESAWTFLVRTPEGFNNTEPFKSEIVTFDTKELVVD